MDVNTANDFNYCVYCNGVLGSQVRLQFYQQLEVECRFEIQTTYSQVTLSSIGYSGDFACILRSSLDDRNIAVTAYIVPIGGVCSASDSGSLPPSSMLAQG